MLTIVNEWPLLKIVNEGLSLTIVNERTNFKNGRFGKNLTKGSRLRNDDFDKNDRFEKRPF